MSINKVVMKMDEIEWDSIVPKTSFYLVKWDEPREVIGKVTSIKEVVGRYGTNKMYVVEFKGQLYGFFDAPKSLHTQLEKMNVKEGTILYIKYNGIDSYKGRTFKSFTVFKWNEGRWETSNGKIVNL